MLRFFFKPLIPPSAHSYLKQYKYVGVDKSFLSKYILNYYWNWVVQWFPLWMAPNLITLIGFCFILLNTGLTLFYSPDLISPVPSYCYYIFGVGIFIYQTLDAIDGKQARRTNQSSPLGHFFDHGCDALNTMLTVITMAPVLRIGGSPILLLSIFLSLGNFYLTTWEEYVTGTLYLGYFSGPVEGVLLISLMLVSLGYFGPELIMTRLPMYFNITFSELFIISGVVVTLLNCVTSVWNVLQHGNRKAFLFLLPYVNFSLLLYTWYRVSPHVVVMASTPFCLFITFGFGRMVGYIIVAHFLKSTFPMTDITWVPIALAILNGKMESWFSMPRILNPTQEYYYTWACAFFSFFMYSIFAFRVIKESCAILNISCFTIKQTKRQKLS